MTTSARRYTVSAIRRMGQRGVAGVAGIQRDPDSRRHEFRRRCRDAAGIPHRVAHADGAGGTATRRRRAGAGRAERRELGGHPDREDVPLPRDCHRRQRGQAGQGARFRSGLRAWTITGRISAEVKTITGKRGVDVAGGARRAGHVAEEPRIARAGRPPGLPAAPTTGYDAQVDSRYLFSKQWCLLGSFMGSMGELHRVPQFAFREAS